MSLQQEKNWFVNVCCVILIALFLCPTSAYASVVTEYENEKIRQTVKKYITVEENLLMTFDEGAALANNEDELVIEVGNKIEEFALAYYYADNSDVMPYVDMNFPVYGNYCGPGTPDYNGVPVDRLDTACQAHDKCYREKGDWNCECDENLIASVKSMLGGLKGTARVAGNAIIAFFELRGFLGC